MRDWLRRLFRRKARVVVPVSNELLRLYAHTASRDGLTVSEWARRTLNAAVPRVELKRLEAGTLRAIGLDAVFDQLDRDEALMPNMLPLTPTVAPARVHIPAVPGHPCAWLRAEYPSGYSAKDCQGTCGSPKQEGRICHWGAAVAPQCEVFAPRFRLPRAAVRPDS